MMNRNSSEFVCDTLEHLDILNSFLQLFIGVNRQPFCELLNQFLTFLPSFRFIDLLCDLLDGVSVGNVSHHPRQRRYFEEPPCCLCTAPFG